MIVVVVLYTILKVLFVVSSETSIINLQVVDSDGNSFIESVDIKYGDNVNEKFLPICERYQLSKEYCEIVQDNAMNRLYSIQYTPTRPTSNLLDFTSDASTVMLYLCQRFHYQSYLEIGVSEGSTFFKMKSGISYVVGVDPAKGGTHRMTSDDFF
jgi:hypothetical protein